MNEKYILVEVIEREISEPTYHPTLESAQAEMHKYARNVLGLEDDTSFEDLLAEIQDYEGDMDDMSGYCTRHGQNFDWKIFEVQ